MNNKHLALATASIFVVAACGGSDNQVEKSLDDSASGLENEETVEQNPSHYLEGSLNGYWDRVIYNDNGITELKSGSDINTVIIGDKVITLVSPDQSMEGFYPVRTNAEQGIVSGSHLSYARYGILRSKSVETTYVFAQGEATADMPQTGSAEYKGFYTYTALDADPNDFISYEGASSFSVDFAAKRLVANFDGLMNIAAEVNGNRFEKRDESGNIRGQFYGSGGAELAGTFFSRDYEALGAFGAAKE